ncbi:hypothetical protein M514_14835 [Trichuris suis]|uniref:Uncharacterized protein n=1 Tax=Trichuris suis TaxID=68888 RepID=A0A085NTY5_9BILA|nr:hypothetical protein M514_14835 [Trichuris suis]
MYAPGMHRLAAFLPESYLHSSGGAAQKGKDPMTCRPTQPLDLFRISALPDFDPFKPSTYSVFSPIQYLDIFRILTSRDFDQLGPTTHMESRHIPNFDPEEYEAL